MTIIKQLSGVENVIRYMNLEFRGKVQGKEIAVRIRCKQLVFKATRLEEITQKKKKKDIKKRKKSTIEKRLED